MIIKGKEKRDVTHDPCNYFYIVSVLKFPEQQTYTDDSQKGSPSTCIDITNLYTQLFQA